MDLGYWCFKLFQLLFVCLCFSGTLTIVAFVIGLMQTDVTMRETWTLISGMFLRMAAISFLLVMLVLSVSSLNIYHTPLGKLKL